MIILENDFLKITFNKYGASITSLLVKKVNRDVVYSYKDDLNYKNNFMFLGCMIGRSSGRIENAIIEIDKNKYQLEKNFLNKHNLHGGKGIHNLLFSYKISNDEVLFERELKHLDDGFVGNVKISLTYKIIDNKLKLNIYATTDRLTYLNLTNHVSFNLNQSKYKTILDHKLYINSKNYIKLNKEMIPKKISKVNSVFDFSNKKYIKTDFYNKNRQLKIANGYDHTYILNNDSNIKATLEIEDLKLNLYTTNKALVVYTGNNQKEGILTKVDKSYKYGSISLEAQGVSNNQKFKEYRNDNLIDIDKPYNENIIWEFI